MYEFFCYVQIRNKYSVIYVQSYLSISIANKCIQFEIHIVSYFIFYQYDNDRDICYYSVNKIS